MIKLVKNSQVAYERFFIILDELLCIGLIIEAIYCKRILLSIGKKI